MKKENRLNQKISKDIWELLEISCLTLTIISMFLTFIVDAEMGIDFPLNIFAEILGMIATLLFIQRYFEKANQIDSDQTKRMTEQHFNELKNVMIAEGNAKSLERMEGNDFQ